MVGGELKDTDAVGLLVDVLEHVIVGVEIVRVSWTVITYEGLA